MISLSLHLSPMNNDPCFRTVATLAEALHHHLVAAVAPATVRWRSLGLLATEAEAGPQLRTDTRKYFF